MFGSYNKVERFAYFDLDLNELAMKQHIILRNLRNKGCYTTVITITQLAKSPVMKYGEIVKPARYSLVVIASKFMLTKKEMSHAIEESQAPSQNGVRK